MQSKLLKCSSCGVFSMREHCPKCGATLRAAHPAKYSPIDKWSAYRRRKKYGR